MDRAAVASPQTIAGNFTQAADRRARPGLCRRRFGRVRGADDQRSLDARRPLGIDLTGGFTLATGDTFDILTFASLAGPASTRFARRLGLHGDEREFVELRRRRPSERSIDATSLDLVVAHASRAQARPRKARPCPNHRPGRCSRSASSVSAASASEAREREPPLPACGERAGVRGRGRFSSTSARPLIRPRSWGVR